MKQRVQRFGKFLSAMVMPNIGAFIAWGFITALFIPDGWIPNEGLASIQPYMLFYLLPILIAGTGGKLVAGERGMVMGAIAVMGCIAGVGGTNGQPMLMGAMLIGPLAGWVIKKFDKFMETRMPAGFEMLINNFSIGIIGMIIAPIVGNIVAIFWFSIMGCGLKGPASPGSIIAFMSMTPKDKMLQTLLGIAIAAGVSFIIASPIVRMAGDKSLDAAQQQMKEMKAESKGQTILSGAKDLASVKKIVFACDAGMGSSAMGATKFRNRLKAARPDITVINTSVDNIPADCDIAVVQTTLQERAKKSAPQAQLVTIGNFLADPNLDNLYLQLTTGDAPTIPEEEDAAEEAIEVATSKAPVLNAQGVKLGLAPVSKEDAIRKAGQLLVEQGCVEPTYVNAMLDREKLVSTYMGMGIAIPHGTAQAKGTVKKTGIVFTQYPEGVDFGDEKAQLVIGIAGVGDEHLDLLSKICDALEDEDVLEKMKSTKDIDWILKVLS